MSTSLRVFPTKTKDVSFSAVFDLTEKNVHKFFASYGIEETVSFVAELVGNERHVIDTNSMMEWKFEEYASLSIIGTQDRTNVVCRTIYEEQDRYDKWSYLSEMVKFPTFDTPMESSISKIKQLDRMWIFTRYAGNSGLFNLCYGYLAAALSELTDGIIYSGDGAWEGNLFPCTASDFLKFYFRPELATDPDFAEWANRCIKSMKNAGLKA